MTLYTDISVECCAWLGSRVEEGALPPGDVLLADVRTLTADHLRPYSHVHLFAGIGGFPLGLAWAGWPDGLSVLTGGFPCPDISVAGLGAGLGTKDAPTARSGLFWQIVRLLDELGDDRPDVCICENVGALDRRGLDTVAASLGEAGYVVPEAYRVGAWAIGAAHQRERWWIVGYRAGAGRADAGPAAVARAAQRCDGCEGAVLADAVCGWACNAAAGGGGMPRGLAPGTGETVLADARGRGLRAVRERQAWPEPHEPVPLHPDADNGQGRIDEPQRRPQGRAASGWADPVAGPWRRERDEWVYDGPPVLVYSGGERRGERDAAGRPDPTRERGHVAPVLPGYTQREWEFPRLHQRGVGDAVHGVPGRMAGALNRSGLVALGNAIVPQVAAALAAGIVRGGRG